ncbi:MAG: hypothetical protein HWN67_05965, partial [Candidatus Helarchaeota archaeon]|nr:hypothetical protein [Candidatus Helarchaeota archaeon]
ETPAIAIDNNNIYIVWVASNGTQKDIVITNSSDWFSTNLTISKNDSWDDTNPDIAIDDSGVVHVVWEAPHNMTGLPDIWYTNSSNNYQNITIISNNPQYGDLTPSIAVGPDNLVYIVWSGVGSSTDEIWHVNSTDNFASNRTISNNPPSANFDRNPDIFVSNSILITWEAGISGVPNIYLVDSSNNWKNRTISSGANYNLYPRIVEGPGNLAHMIWILNITYNYSVLYSNNLGNYTTNTTIAMNSSSPFPGDIGVDSTGRVHIIWICNNQTYYNSSTYPDYPAVRLLKSNLLPMELNKPGTAMLAYGEFYDEFYIEKVEIMWSTNTGVSWNNFLMFGSGNGTKWKGTGFIPGYQYGVVLLYKFKIVDKVGQEHETAQQMFYYPDTRTESIVLIIILFGVLGTLTALYLIPQTRRFFGKLFSRKKPETAEKPKKPEVEKTPES